MHHTDACVGQPNKAEEAYINEENEEEGGVATEVASSDRVEFIE